MTRKPWYVRWIHDLAEEYLRYIFSPFGLVTILLIVVSLWMWFLPNDLINDKIGPAGMVDDAMMMMFAMYVIWKIRKRYKQAGKYPWSFA